MGFCWDGMGVRCGLGERVSTAWVFRFCTAGAFAVVRGWRSHACGGACWDCMGVRGGAFWPFDFGSGPLQDAAAQRWLDPANWSKNGPVEVSSLGVRQRFGVAVAKQQCSCCYGAPDGGWTGALACYLKVVLKCLCHLI